MKAGLLKRFAQDALPRQLVEGIRHQRQRRAVARQVRAERRCHDLFIELPTSSAVRFLEAVRMTGRLDYDGHDIRMKTSTAGELKRLRACEKEPETVAWIEDHVRPGDAFYDIGANVGAYSFVAYASTTGQCTVYAFEAGFASFATLSENIFINGCQGRVLPLHVALADETRMAAFNYSSLAPGAAFHSLNEREIGVAGRQAVFSQPILCYRLDDLIREFDLPVPSHIKLDVDGAELMVLEGAQETLASPALRSLLVEVDEECQPETPSLLEAHGFSVESRHPRARSGSSHKVFNYVFSR